MPSRRTYFEQVPIAEIETVLQQDLASERMLEKPATPIPALKGRSIERILKQKANAPSKGPL